jgi:hypothetical protein
MRYSIINFATMKYSSVPVIFGGKLVVDIAFVEDFITREPLPKVIKYPNGVIEAYSDKNNRPVYKKFRVFIPETHTLFNLPLLDHYVDNDTFNFNVDVKDFTIKITNIIYSLISKEMKESLP